MATRLMVIDDTPEILARFQELLAEEGYEVMAYTDAKNNDVP